MDLLTVLEKTTSPHTVELELAQRFLEDAAQQNFPELLKQLSDVLRHGGNSAVARMQAGLQLKNALYSKDQTVRAEHQQRWLLLPEDVRLYIKKNVMEAIGTETTRPSSAAQCVASIACAELPHGLWGELIAGLTSIMTKQDTNEIMRESTLEAIGYICQDIDPDLLQTQSNSILTAIVQGMKKDEPSNLVRYAATTALCNSLEFSKANFNNETERNYIMQVVCEATQSEEPRVKVAALQCLVKIMSLYYQHMEHYMAVALFAITMEAMKSDVDEISLQGIEFWSNVCDEEVDLTIEASEAAEAGKPPDRTSKFYVKGALNYLVPILLHTLTKQEETDDDDEWNPCKAAGVCLMLMAACTEDAIVGYVLPFVKTNIQNENWKFRDAAVMAFGSILEGPDTTNLKPVVVQAIPMLIELLKDKSVIVQDTAAWTVGRVCEIIPDAVINDAVVDRLIEALLIGLNGEPRVAANVCWAFSSLAEAAYENTSTTDDSPEPETYILSRYFELIVRSLLRITEREDGNQHNLRSAAYEAVMEMVKNSPKDCYSCVQETTLNVLDKLQRVLSMEGHFQSSKDRVQYLDLQSLLCATLQSVLRKVTPEDAPKISDRIMMALLHMLAGSGEKIGGVQEDALLAVSTLIEVLGEQFMKYMDTFKPYLYMGLKNHAEHQVCLAAVGATGDLCRSLGIKILPYCNEIMTVLLENLGNENVHRSVKPQILAAFGDIALAIGSNFTIYLEVVLGTLQQASQAVVVKSDYDMVDYINDLWEGSLVAYTGIVQGLKGDGEQANNELTFLQNHVPFMVSFIEHIAQDEDKSDTVIAVSCGLLGDLLSAFGAAILPGIDKEPISSLLVQGRKCRYSKAKSLATWVTKEIKKLKQQDTTKTS